VQEPPISRPSMKAITNMPAAATHNAIHIHEGHNEHSDGGRPH
jgi:hypothetical protein